tara:strand:+ start:506 stop:991 length:486 start_codon:yes stop_codon:yes gene_type:complete
MGPLEWQTTRTINYGILVKPALDLSSYGLTVQGEIEPNKPTVPGDWFLAVFYDKKCGAICERLIDQVNRIQNAIGRDRTRVNIVILSPEPMASNVEQPYWLLTDGDRFIRELHRATNSQQKLPAVLIVDHRRRAALMYPPKDDAQDALRDLKRLLKSSAPP